MTEQRRNEIVSRWRAGASMRQIARELGLARNTVSRVLVGIDAQRAGKASTSLRRPSRLDPYEPVILELLGRYPDLTGVRLLEELRQQWLPGQLQHGPPAATRATSALRDHCRLSALKLGRASRLRWIMPSTISTSLAKAGARVNLFSYILGYSRRQYLRFVEAQDLMTTLREHVRAFAHLGGVAATCLYDNMKVVVSGYEDDVPVYNPRFLAFATHYGFRPVACRVRRPQTKGKVERPFHYVETSLFNGRSFESLDHLNEITDWWLAQVADVRELRAAGKTPLQLHQEELPHLIPLPNQAYEVAPVIYRTVDVEGLVTYCQNGYSVPWRYIGCVLPVRVTETEVIVYGPHVEEITRHALLPRTARGQRSVHKEHRPSENAHRRRAQLEERFAELGEVGRRFLEGLLRVQRYGKDQAQRVLALLGTYARSDVIAALERAVRYGAYSHAAVARILSVQARPKTALEALAEEERALPPWLGEDKVSPRPTSGYQYLCEPEEHEDEDQSSTQGEAGGDGTAPEDP